MAFAEDVRTALYPLGMMATIIFALRFGIQWLQSERLRRSVVTPSFWWLSILGNVSLIGHTLIQGQYPVCVVQAINGVIACRNLNLMGSPEKRWRLRSVLILLSVSILAPTLLFWFFSQEAWLRVPAHLFQPAPQPVSAAWHIAGSIGIILHSSRFWVQWINAERYAKSSLETPFWWLSILGALFSIFYFARLLDYINLAGPLFGLIPYCRNLILIYSKRALEK
jgi:lipid-A-disaccharide synthase